MEKTKKKDRFMLISVSVLAFIVAVILIVAFLVPVWSAKLKLSKTVGKFEGFSDGDTIVVADPLFDGESIPEGAEVILAGEQGRDIADALVGVLDGAKYTETQRTLVGGWCMNVSIRTDDRVYTVYLLEDEFYLTKDNKQFVFTPDGEVSDEYDLFCERLVNILGESSEN